MMKQHWVTAAFTSDTLVAELLLRLKQSPSSDSAQAPSPPSTETTTTASLNPLRWGNRKSRSKSSTSTAAVAVTVGFRKEEQQRSPSTPLYWSVGVSGAGAGAASTSDGSDEFSRLSDLAGGARSIKGAFANEGSTSYIKSRKRKDLGSMHTTLIQQMATGDTFKRPMIDLHQNPDQFIQISSCKVESEIETRERFFVLPDLNMTPSDEGLDVP